MNYLKTFLPYLFGNKQGKSYVLPPNLDWENLNFEETLMFHALQKTLGSFTNTLTLSTLTTQQIFHLLSFENHLNDDFAKKLKEHFSNEYELIKKAKSKDTLSVYELQEILDLKNHMLSVFVLLHHDRTKPGKLFIRKADGRFIHRDSGNLWFLPVLGLSGRGLPFNHSNGSTPCGVLRIDSVMPEANKNYEFGKFRRLIVNFLEKTPNEENIKQFLPTTHHKRNWWLPSVVGRELGRSLLRIHGTGRVNKNPFTPFYPMVPTSGCLATNEARFMGLFEKNDQRLLLDALMEASNLPKTYENESKIHGLLYVIEFDDTYQALEFRG